MKRGKTEIWKGGLAELLEGPGATRGTQPVQPAPATAARDATRILPIEQLVSGVESVTAIAVAPPSEPAADAEAAQLAAGLRRLRARRVARALLGLLVVVVIAVLLLRRGPARSPEPRQKPAVATSEVPRAAEEKPATAARGRSLQIEPPPPAIPRAGTTLERAAVDALASGDHAAAIRLYRALESRHPDRPVYARAAAILQARAPRAR